MPKPESLSQTLISVLFVISIFAFFLYPGSSYAEFYSSEYSGWIRDDYTFSFNSITFNSSVVGEKVRIYSSLGSIILENNSCKELSDYNFCITNHELEYLDKTLADVYDRFYLTVSMKRAKVSISRHVSDTYMPIGTESLVTTRLYNSGSLPAEIYYYEDMPGFVISGIKGCILNDSRIYWKGSLGIASEHLCSYTIRSSNKTFLSSKAYVKYFDGKEEHLESSDESVITVPEYEIIINADISPENISAGDKLSLYITINNTQDQAVTLDYFSITIPEPIRIYDLPRSFNEYSGIIKGPVHLEGYGSETFNITAEALRTGNYSLNISAKYNIGSISREIKSSVYLNVYFDTPDITVSLINGTLFQGKDYKIMLNLVNPSKEHYIYDITAAIESDFKELPHKKEITSIPINGFEHLYYGKIIAPDLHRAFVNVTVIYHTPDKEKLLVSKNINFTILNNPKPKNSTAHESENKKSISGDNGLSTRSYTFILVILVVIVLAYICFRFARRKKHAGHEHVIVQADHDELHEENSDQIHKRKKHKHIREKSNDVVEETEIVDIRPAKKNKHSKPKHEHGGTEDDTFRF